MVQVSFGVFSSFHFLLRCLYGRWMCRFGAEKGKASGPDRATTTVGEDLQLKLSAGNQKVRLSLFQMCLPDDTKHRPSLTRPNLKKTRLPSSSRPLDPKRLFVVCVREITSRQSVLSRGHSKVPVWTTCSEAAEIRVVWTSPHPLKPWPLLPTANTYLLLCEEELEDLVNQCSPRDVTTSPPSESLHLPPRRTRTICATCLEALEGLRGPTLSGTEIRERAKGSDLSASSQGWTQKRRFELWTDEVSFLLRWPL